jgi:predicted nucleic acid-binding protein
MVLVDTSVWVGFLREGDSLLSDLLNEGEVLTHPFIIGELRLGNISKRHYFLSLINDLPQATQATEGEVTHLIEKNKLYGKGIGYIDAHILASSIMSVSPLWTLDKRLDAISKRMQTTNKSA